jgi:hypothetical protein
VAENSSSPEDRNRSGFRIDVLFSEYQTMGCPSPAIVMAMKLQIPYSQRVSLPIEEV